MSWPKGRLRPEAGVWVKAALRGRPQSADHVRRRAESTKAACAEMRKTCGECSGEFTPTQSAQRYCSGRCWSMMDRRRKPRKLRLTIPPALYAGMKETQGSECAICGCLGGSNNRGDRLAVDHDHKTGVVRGLLCHKCNTAIGLLQDNPEILRRAADYLDRPPFNIKIEGVAQ